MIQTNNKLLKTALALSFITIGYNLLEGGIIDWSTKTLRQELLGRRVKVKGWLLFDAEHENQSENTNPRRKRNWRATAWEIHPVTGIHIVSKLTN